MYSAEVLDIDITNWTKNEQTVPSCISKISVSESYSDFFNQYLLKNIPCIIKDVALEWESFSQWVSNDAPNLKNLVSKYGSIEVPVTDCRKADQCKNYIPFEEYAEYLKGITPEKSLESIMYLKDWHLRRESPEDDFYQVPKYFASDWLNEYSVDNNRDDYMFVYFGPKGSWTPFHADVYTSFSWSANVVGKKKWILFPPGEESKFLDSMGNLPSDIGSMLNDGLTYFQVIQNRGDAIFVPSGWFHQVWNMEDTISINHNWINGCNIDTMLKSLKKNIEMVESEIIEFKDTEGWMEHCQVMLQSLFGINYKGFFEFVKYITVKRLNSLKNGCHLTFGNWHISNNHIVFDLKALRGVLENLVTEPYLDKERINESKELIENICNVIKSIIPGAAK